MADTAAPLQILRKSIKDWEASFSKINGRKPSPAEIKENPEMHKLYIQYGELKRSNHFSAEERQSKPELVLAPSADQKQNQSGGQLTEKKEALKAKSLSKVNREHIEMWKQQREKSKMMALSSSRSISCHNGKQSAALIIEYETANEVPSDQDKRSKKGICSKSTDDLIHAGLSDINHESKSLITDGKDRFFPCDPSSPSLKMENSEMKAATDRTSILNLSKVVCAPRRGLIFREQSRSVVRSDTSISPKDSVDLYCHEVLTPFDTSAMLVSPSIATPELNLQGREHDIHTVRKHLFSEINQEIRTISSTHNDQNTPMIKRQQVENFVPDSHLMLQQSVSYSQPKAHPLQKKAEGKSAAGAPVRENFVRMQPGSRKRLKGRGSKAGGSKPMGWKKSLKQFKTRGSKSGKCFTCGKTGHWSKDCPNLEGSANGNVKPKDGEDLLDLVADELLLSDPVKTNQSDERIVPSNPHPVPSAAISIPDENSDPIPDQFEEADAAVTKKPALGQADCRESRPRSSRKRKSLADSSAVVSPVVKRRGLRSRVVQANPEHMKMVKNPVLDGECDESNPDASAASNTRSTAGCIDAVPTSGRVDEEIDAVPTSGIVGEENMKETLQVLFGHEDFRSGQEEALERVLDGKSTLFISATGGGKSLCYQLPAYKLKGTTLVVSPLLSLIQDQLEHLPSSIRGATLNSQQTQDEYHSVVQRLKAGEVDVLFVAPERLFTDAFISVARCLPPFPLVCIDEVHCVSEWAHNFRPSYLRLRPLLRDVLHARCILGLTATATRSMEREITEALGIEPEGIVRSDLLRKNLRLTVSRDKNRQLSLLDMLQKDPRFKTGSVIVYCSLRAQCEDVAKYLIGQSVSAAYYHAGRTPRDRQSIQNRFFSGKLRVVVATVAFGMGLDKSNVRGIIHYSCPQSIESYVQEIGRAGRDGQTANCHLFLHEDDETRMRSFAHGEGIEKVNVLRILNHVLVGSVDHAHASEGGTVQRQAGEYVQIDEEDDVIYDVARESIETILCFLEQEGLVEVCNSTAAYGNLAFLTSQRRELEQSSKVVSAIVSLASPRNGQWKFTPTAVANRLNCSISQVTRELRCLKAQRLLRVEWSGRACVCRVLGTSNISDAVTAVAEVIHQRFVALEQRKVIRLQTLHNMLACVAEGSWAEATEERQSVAAVSTESQGLDERQGQVGLLARMIGDYFTQERQPQGLNEEMSITCSEGTAESGQSKLHNPAAGQEVSLQTDRFLRADIINLLHNIQKDNPLTTGRSVARILHGLQSPAFPAKVWYRHNLWGRYATTDFDVIRTIANAVIAAHP